MVLTDLGEVGHEGGDVQPVGEAVQNGVDARQGGLSEGLAVVDLKEKTREVEVLCARKRNTIWLTEEFRSLRLDKTHEYRTDVARKMVSEKNGERSKNCCCDGDREAAVVRGGVRPGK